MHLVWDIMVVSSIRFLAHQIMDSIIIYCGSSSFSLIHIFMQESGQISVTDYVRVTSTEWYAIGLTI
jgi:hypothetical protein